MSQCNGNWGNPCLLGPPPCTEGPPTIPTQLNTATQNNPHPWHLTQKSDTDRGLKAPHAPLLLPWGALRVDWWFDQDRSRSVFKLMWTCQFVSAKCVKEDVFDFKKCLGWMALWGLQAKLKCSVDWEPEGLQSKFETQSKSWRATCNLLTLDSTQKLWIHNAKVGTAHATIAALESFSCCYSSVKKSCVSILRR